MGPTEQLCRHPTFLIFYSVFTDSSSVTHSQDPSPLSSLSPFSPSISSMPAVFSHIAGSSLGSPETQTSSSIAQWPLVDFPNLTKIKLRFLSHWITSFLIPDIPNDSLHLAVAGPSPSPLLASEGPRLAATDLQEQLALVAPLGTARLLPLPRHLHWVAGASLVWFQAVLSFCSLCLPHPPSHRLLLSPGLA